MTPPRGRRNKAKVLLIEGQRLAANAWDGLEEIVIISGIGLVILLQIPWLDGLFSKLNIRDSSNLTTTVLLAVLFGVYSQFHRLNRIVVSSATSARQFISDPVALYPILIDRALMIRRPEEKTVDVLGMTLYTAWPSLSFWLQRNDINGWTVRLATLAASAHLDSVPADWPAESGANVASARMAAKSAGFVARKIEIEVYEYDFAPVVHGFRLGNGDLFISFLRWDNSGQLGKEGYTYEFFPADDETESAESHRLLFDSWFERAKG